MLKVGVLVASNRLLARIAAHIVKRWWGGKASFLLFEVGKTSNCDHKIVTFIKCQDLSTFGEGLKIFHKGVLIY